MSQCKGTAFALPAHQIHSQCFKNPWSEKEFADLLVLPTTRLWMDEVGLLMCSCVSDEMEILTFGIIPQKRRQGLGQKMLDTMFKYAQENEIHKIFLDVAEDNIPAIQLYEKMGFQKINLRQGYYDNGHVNALIYVKVI